MSGRRSLPDFLRPDVEFDDPGDPGTVRNLRVLTKESADPALLAARHMLRLALSSQSLKEQASAPGKVLIVQVADPGWLDPVMDQWTDIVRNGAEAHDGDTETHRDPEMGVFQADRQREDHSAGEGERQRRPCRMAGCRYHRIHHGRAVSSPQRRVRGGSPGRHRVAEEVHAPVPLPVSLRQIVLRSGHEGTRIRTDAVHPPPGTASPDSPQTTIWGS